MPHRAKTVSRLPPAARRAGAVCALAALLLGTTAPPAPVADRRLADGAPAADLEAIQRAFEQVVARVAPSVVGIRAERRYFTTLDDDAGRQTLEQRIVINGSGTVVAPDGLILTNEHVVQAAAQIDVLFHDGQKLRASLWASDPRSDLAVLHVERRDLTPATFCDWDQVGRGQWTIALGNPFGLSQDGSLSVSIGIVSNLGRQLPGLGQVDDRFYSNMIQTTAPINPGNSGGPLFNIHGELIGVVTAMHTRTPADDGVGFAIPMTPAKRRVVATLCAGRPVQYGYLGLTVRVLESDERAAAGSLDCAGVVVERVEPEGPAARAGVQTGDLLLRYGTEPVEGPAHLAELVGYTPVGTRVDLHLRRAGQPLTLSATVEERDVSRVSWMRGGAVLWRGLRVADLTDDARRLMRLDPAARGVVVIEVTASSPAGAAGLAIGQIIDAVAGHPVRDTRDFLEQVRGVRGALDLSVRGQGPRTVGP